MNGLILAKNSLILSLSTDSGSNTKLIGIEPYNVLLSLERLYFFDDLEAHVARYDFLADGSDSDSDDEGEQYGGNRSDPPLTFSRCLLP
jgi:hypothetical protein